MGARAGRQKAPVFYKLHGPEIDFPVALDGTFNGIAGFGESRRVQYHHCGSCFHVIWNQEREAAGLDQRMSEDTSAAVTVGVEAMKLLIERDRAAR